MVEQNQNTEMTTPPPVDIKKIDAEYSKLCLHYGDLFLKSIDMRNRMDEMEERAALLFAQRRIYEASIPEVPQAPGV